MECPTKLFYTGKPEYANSKIEDSFLLTLADGGFQVGALARCYFPEGILIETPNDQAAAEATAQYLERDQVTLFEAVFRHERFLVRVDVIVKNGTRLDLYEVKAKSCDFSDQSGMLNKKGTISSDWKKYVEDVAFQKHVIRMAHPRAEVHAHLMLTDKTAECPTDGLNQKFRLVREENRRRVEVAATLADADLTPRILRAIDVDDACELVFASVIRERTFAEHVAMLADSHARDEKIPGTPSKVCGKCEFRPADTDIGGALLSGHHECWRDGLNWTAEDFNEPTVLDVWNLGTKDKLIETGKIKFSQLEEADIGPKPDGKPGMSTKERQWLQIDLARRNVTEPYFDRAGLAAEMKGWTFPLHFIDFETSMPAIPFKQGRRPYEGILFQFSHHTVTEDGRVAHAGEFISAEPGSFPNYDCIRELKRQLEGDNGTVFRYAIHENSYLCAIRDQLLRDAADIPGRLELAAFIETIANPRNNKEENWEPTRPMVDMCELVKRFHYDPAAGGSCSLKFVLPATLNSSAFLKQKYSAPIYGSPGGIPSLNFRNQTWAAEQPDGRIIDPYKLLPPLFTDESPRDYAAIINHDKINDGGAAMTAYCKLQFENLPPDARTQIHSALLKYCELDTLAMVMLYEAWKAVL